MLTEAEPQTPGDRRSSTAHDHGHCGPRRAGRTVVARARAPRGRCGPIRSRPPTDHRTRRQDHSGTATPARTALRRLRIALVQLPVDDLARKPGAVCGKRPSQAVLSTSAGFMDTRSVPMVGSGAIQPMFLYCPHALIFFTERGGRSPAGAGRGDGVKKRTLANKDPPVATMSVNNPRVSYR